MSDDELAAKIANNRSRGYRFANDAHERLLDGDLEMNNVEAIMLSATLATMYFTLALDAHTFGGVPEWDGGSPWIKTADDEN